MSFKLYCPDCDEQFEIVDEVTVFSDPKGGGEVEAECPHCNHRERLI